MAIHLDLKVCLVRPWRPEDATLLPRHAGDRRVWRNLRDRFPHPYTQREAEAWVRFATTSEPVTQYAIDIDGEAVGGIGFELHGDIERIAAEVGYWLGPEHWGRGVMGRVVPAFSRAVFAERPELLRLYALPFAENTASVRVLERAGYRLEGRTRQSVVKDGQVLDQLLYALLRDEL